MENEFSIHFNRFKRKINIRDEKNTFDFCCLENNSEEILNRIEKVKLQEIPVLLDKNCCVYQISGLEGFSIITSALNASQQLDWSRRCLEEYSQYPYNNLSLLNHDDKDLWKLCCSVGDLKRFGKLRWCTLGYHYDWTERRYVDSPGMPPFPKELNELAVEAASLVGYPKGTFQGESGIINYYPLGKTMGGHIDDAEHTMEKPIVSISLGLSCIFLIGGTSKEQTPLSMILNSGDIVIMGKTSRCCYHGVPRIIEDSLHDQVVGKLKTSQNNNDYFLGEYLKKNRININIRQVFHS